jgi:hypothetical protein
LRRNAAALITAFISPSGDPISIATSRAEAQLSKASM